MKKCDIVMKGGITSGVVYPGVVCKLAEQYEFCSIGGTSAGAIAASLTAAAEYARKRGRNVFGELAKVPGWLGANSTQARGSNLFNLFQPQPRMRGLFHVATAFLLQGWWRRAAAVLRVLWIETLLGIGIGAAVRLIAGPQQGWACLGVFALALMVALGFIVLFGALGLLFRLSFLPRFHYGFCFGYTKPEKNTPVSLVEWLNEKMTAFAGDLAPGEPLTFGRLQKAGITLKMITTCLSFGRPFTLPFDTNEFYFSPDEMRHYMPANVVQWMEDHPHSIKHDTRDRPVDLTGFKPLPAPEDMPVILAARLSLSFPFLFCAVPLYAIDFSRRVRKPDDPPRTKEREPGDALDPGEPLRPERVWFADGGITSNFPIHLFDGPLPSWPTFGLDLAELRPDQDEKSDRTWMPTSNRGGMANQWTRLDTSWGLGAGTAAFSMIDAARNWMDNLQAAAPGYRDRIVHVFLNKEEGGLNLNMPPETVTTLSAYGTKAAGHLIDHFINGTDGGKPTDMTWDNQRWVRYRSTSTVLREFLIHYSTVLQNPEPGDSSILDMICRGNDEPPNSYRFTQQCECAREMTKALMDVADESKDCNLEKGTPHPEPQLLIRPKF